MIAQNAIAFATTNKISNAFAAPESMLRTTESKITATTSSTMPAPKTVKPMGLFSLPMSLNNRTVIPILVAVKTTPRNKDSLLEMPNERAV
jgi:hypothetical protein